MEKENMPNKTFYITTQILENYGSHYESGKFEDSKHYWKFKSGNEYIIDGFERVQDAVAFVMFVTSNNNFYKEYPVTYEEVYKDFVTEREKEQLEDEGKITFKATRIDYSKYFPKAEEFEQLTNERK
jgi:hypothetical protein